MPKVGTAPELLCLCLHLLAFQRSTPSDSLFEFVHFCIWGAGGMHSDSSLVFILLHWDHDRGLVAPHPHPHPLPFAPRFLSCAPSNRSPRNSPQISCSGVWSDTSRPFGRWWIFQAARAPPPPRGQSFTLGTMDVGQGQLHTRAQTATHSQDAVQSAQREIPFSPPRMRHL